MAIPRTNGCSCSRNTRHGFARGRSRRAITGRCAAGGCRDSAGSTEAPDETARGDWMKLVANAGLQWDKAVLEYLVRGNHEVERKLETFWNGVSLSINRPRPPKPADEKKPTTEER